MGIFSKLFGSHAKGSKSEVETSEEEYNRFQIPGLYKGMRADVVDDTGAVIMELRVKDYSSVGVTFQNIDGYSDITVIPKDEENPTTLYFRGYSEDHKPVIFSGVVKESTSKALRVADMALTDFSEHREQFRLPIQMQGEVTLKVGSAAIREPCTIKDVSSGGACFTSARDLKDNTKVVLRIPFAWSEPKDGEPAIPTVEMNLDGYTVRKVVRPGDIYEYGVQFTSLTESLRSELLTNLYSVQMRWRKEAKDREEGIY